MNAATPPAWPDPIKLRAGFEAALAEGNFGLAHHQAEILWYAAPTLATAGFLKTRFKPIAEALAFPTKRVTILRGFTVETMAPLVEVCGLLSRFSLNIQLGQYNAYMQELMDASGLAVDADVALAALHTRTAAPALWQDTDVAEMQKAADWLVENLRIALEAFRSTSSAPLVLQLLDSPADADTERSARIADANQRLRDAAAAIPDTYTFDIDDLVAKPGQKWHDERNWTVAKMPFRTDRASDLAARWMQYIRPLLGAPAKVIVTDLDNTVWGGILGEDGPANLVMGEGSGFRAVQRALLDAKQRGFLLTIASKNDETAALPVLETHPDSLIRPNDIAAHRIDWSAKSENIRAMADELALGLDSFMFLDDNPAERAHVAADLPMVRILPHSDDPFVTARMLTAHPDLQRLKITAEDAARTELYKARRERTVAAVGDPAARTAFIASLQQQVLIEPLTDETFVRAADLERKTNQFNLRTRRFTETNLRVFAAKTDSFIRTFRVLDRFGDNGIVGLGVVTLHGETAVIENLLMSCRVIGRNVEADMLRDIAQHAALRGAKTLVGGFMPTAKNAMTHNFYSTAGFTALPPDNTIERWQSPLTPEGLPDQEGSL